MQPSLEGAHLAHGVTLVKGEATAAGAVPVNDERFWKRRAEDVPVDEAFFRTFFVRKHEKDRRKAAKVAKRKGKGDGSDSEGLSGSESDADEGRDVGESGSESGEEVDDEAAAGSDSEDGGFDLSTKGEKAAPGASDEDEEQDSDAEEAEIWKVRSCALYLGRVFTTDAIIGDEGHDALGAPGRRLDGR